MTFEGLLSETISSNFQISIKEKKRELRTATETTKLTLTSEPNYEPQLLNMQQHYIMKFQNHHKKKLKYYVLLFLS